jgi:hypothetical protein
MKSIFRQRGANTIGITKIIDNNGLSQLKTCLMAAHHFLLSEKEAIEFMKSYDGGL